MTQLDVRQEVFRRLRGLLKDVTKGLKVKADAPGQFLVDTRHIMSNKQALNFGGVRSGKDYVSFYLMPVYIYQELLEGISPELRARMQGKSCFNFRSVNEDLFAELEKLARRSLERYKKEGYI